MKLKTLIGLLMMALTPFVAMLSSCKDNELWEELPEKISQFITQYFPNS